MAIGNGSVDRASSPDVVRHINPDGTVGGWVSGSAKISSNVHIDFTAVVGPWAIIPPGSWIGAHSYIGMSNAVSSE